MCEREGIDPVSATRAHIALFVSELRTRPSRHGPKVVVLDSGSGLANAMLQQRLVPVRLFDDFLVEEAVRESNPAFQGTLCLFLLEMGMTASRKLRDLRSAGTGFIIFGLLVPNLFATLGISIAHGYAHLTHTEFKPGTYILFAVLCAAASYIAVASSSYSRMIVAQSM